MSPQPSTLTRASKKRRTRERILANALALFRSRGIRAAKLSEVASSSEIAPATLFNYFPTKGCLAEAWVRGEIAEILDHVIEDAADHDRSLRAAVRTACRQLAALSAAEPVLRLEAWQEAGRAPQRVADGEPESILVRDLREEQKRERVRQDIQAMDLASTLLDAIEGGLIQGLQQASGGASTHHSAGVESDSQPSEALLTAELTRSIRTRVDLVLDGFRKRNERVSASAARPSTASNASQPAVSRNSGATRLAPST